MPAVTAGTLLLILGYIMDRGVSSLNWAFFVNLPAPVGKLGGGMANAIYGSFLLVGMATVFSVPIGLLAAIYITEYRHGRLAPTVRFISELLGGVPSIVIGLFVYALVVKPMGHFSAWAGAFALGVMMIPIIVRASEEALKLVPEALRHASFALGASHRQTVVRVVVPTALPAVITAVFWRSPGRRGTAPLLLTAFSNSYWPKGRTISRRRCPCTFSTMPSAHTTTGTGKRVAAAFVLIVIVMVLNAGVRIVSRGKAVAAAFGMTRRCAWSKNFAPRTSGSLAGYRPQSGVVLIRRR